MIFINNDGQIIDSDVLCRWTNEPGYTRYARQEVGSLSMISPIAYMEPREVDLWKALRMVHPGWRRGAQGIGDCVSWGAELVATCLMALQHVKGESQWLGEAATEPIYGGARVEARGKNSGGWSDGATGFGAAKWLRDWGVILRADYTDETAIQEHDLRRYDAKKAKQWGNYGCGGRSDVGKLDTIAKNFPIQQVTAVNTGMDIIRAVSNGYPVTIASMAGFGRMQRDANGVCRIVGRWAHQMCILGTKMIGGVWHGRIFQSWGSSCSGPDPGIDWDAVSACSWWTPLSDLDRIATSGDCWAFSDIEGFPPQTVDFREAASSWYRPSERVHYELAM